MIIKHKILYYLVDNSTDHKYFNFYCYNIIMGGKSQITKHA